MLHVTASLLAGYALFLVGLKEFTQRLNQLSSESFNHIVQKGTSNCLLSIISGLLLGILSAGNIILSVCIAGAAHVLNILSAHKTLFLVNFSRLGSCLYIFLASFNLKLAILLVMGIAGIGFAIGRPQKWQVGMGLLFQLALVLFGIQLIKTSADLLDDNPFVLQLISYTQSYPFVSFLAGAFVMLLSQSLFASLVICISFVGSDAFSLDEALLCTAGIYFLLALTRYFYLFAFDKNFRFAMGFIPVYYFIATALAIMIYFALDPLVHSFSFMAPFATWGAKNQLAFLNFVIHFICTLSLHPFLPYFYPKKKASKKLSHSIPEEVFSAPSLALAYLKQGFEKTLKHLEMSINPAEKQAPEALNKLYNASKKSLGAYETLLKALVERSTLSSKQEALVKYSDRLFLLKSLRNYYLQVQELSSFLHSDRAALALQELEKKHLFLHQELLSPQLDISSNYFKLLEEQELLIEQSEQALTGPINKAHAMEIAELLRTYKNINWVLRQLFKTLSTKASA